MTFARDNSAIAVASGGAAQTTINVAGTGVYVIPSGYTTLTAEIWGASAAGCPGTGSGDSAVGGGGGGAGGYCLSSLNVSAAGGETINYQCGASLNAKVPATSANASTLTSGTFSLTSMSAGGGGGGGQGTTGNAGAGGTATGGGTTNTAGNAGTFGGSSGAGQGGNGIVGINGTGPFGGHGGYLGISFQAGKDGLIKFTLS